ncbi:response regulator transcription factor [Streptomyces sp. NPDC053542]|uniref:response regulator transcription factor n=1 Tax=Streptomyces sp. NPDC053542 TaxID=3365710 RepID=UPI0037D52C01
MRLVTTGGVRVFLISAQTLFLDGIRHLLAQESDLHVVGVAETCETARQRIAECRPEVAVISGGACDANGALIAEHILSTPSKPRVVLIGAGDESFNVIDVVRLGISAYLPRQTTGLQLKMAIRMAAGTSGHVTVSLSREEIERLAEVNRPMLSHVESEILLMVSTAMTNGQIARKLSLTEATVKRHMRNIFRRLGAVSRIDAVNKARKANILLPGKLERL